MRTIDELREILKQQGPGGLTPDELNKLKKTVEKPAPIKIERKERKKKELTADEVYRRAAIGCTCVEIAEAFRVSVDMIQDNFNLDLHEGWADFKEELRQMQYESAKKNVAMQIWLGKQVLGQAEKQDINIPNSPVATIKFSEVAEDLPADAPKRP